MGCESSIFHQFYNGAVAQAGERHARIVEVWGALPAVPPFCCPVVQSAERRSLKPDVPRGPFWSVNAKQLAQPVFQAGPNRCKSDHGCHGQRSSDRAEHRPAKAGAAGATPAADAILRPLCLERQQGEFRKLVFVGASPTRGSISWWSWCNSSIVPCDGVGDGANPFGHPNFDGPMIEDYRLRQMEA